MLLTWLKDVRWYLFNVIEQFEDNKAAQARSPKPPKKRRQEMSTNTSRLVRALRAKANDPSVTRAEAAAFAAKADELEKR